MKRSHTGSIIGRREFLKRGVLAGVGVSILPLAGSASASIEAAAPQVRRYSTLGRTGLRISDISFGASRLTSGQEDLVRHAFDCGVNYFDSAETYTDGESETTVGNALKGKRDKVFLTSKTIANADDRRDSMMTALEGSLRRLQTDHIDLYQMHHIDRATPWDEIWQAMELLVQQGKVLYVGSSNFAGWHIARASERAARRKFLGLVSEQSKYNLLERTVELEVIPACREYGLGLIAWSPLGSGTLARAGRAGGGVGRRGGKWAQDLEQRHGAKLEAFGRLCGELGEEPADVALAWLLANPVVTAPIIGPRTRAQLDGVQHALDLTLDAATLAKLDELFPGPGKPAPEAYAW